MEEKILSYERRFNSIFERGHKFCEDYEIRITTKYNIPKSKQNVQIISSKDADEIIAIGKELDEIRNKYEALKRNNKGSDENDYYFPFGRE